LQSTALSGSLGIALLGDGLSLYFAKRLSLRPKRIR
jgi:hypothetical protein